MCFFKKVVEQISKKSAKIGYDPATGTNWCHLPLEMRSKCIEEMDFQSRIRLSSTSMTEKLLVEDAPKYPFFMVNITYDDSLINVRALSNPSWTNSEFITSEESLSHETHMNLALRLLKTCHVDGLEFEDYKSSKTVITDLAECVPFSFKSLEAHSENWETMEFFLDNSPDLEVITSNSLLMFYEAIDHPVVVNLKEIRVEYLEKVFLAWELIENWIELDAEVGKSIQFVADQRNFDVAGYFAARFEERLIEKNEDVVRIRMNNEAMQIILRTIGTDYKDEDYFSCKVVSIDLPESEFEKGDEWITELLEENEYGFY